jgi:putative endonuclease
MKIPSVYIVASRYRGTLYIGVTSALTYRISQHRAGTFDGFTKKYGVKILVWYEVHVTMDGAISREKQMKEWKRAWKIALIERANPHWRDLFDEIAS